MVKKEWKRKSLPQDKNLALLLNSMLRFCLLNYSIEPNCPSSGKIICVVLLLIFLHILSPPHDNAGACTEPKVESRTYSTSEELMSSQVVFILEMDVECEGSEVC